MHGSLQDRAPRSRRTPVRDRPSTLRHRRSTLLLAACLLNGWLLCAAAGGSGPDPRPPAVPRGAESGAPRLAAPGYVPDAVCATCHTEIARGFSAVGMSRSFFVPSPDRDVEDLEPPGNRYLHAASGQVFEMARRGRRLLFRRYQLDSEGRWINLYETEVAWVLGSGNHARTYLIRDPAGELFQLPIAWYTQEGRWGMAPGFDRPDHLGLARQVQRDCMFCHDAYPRAPAGSDRPGEPAVFPAAPPDLAEGIGCQRCHGPGAEHVDLASGIGSPRQVQDAIVNPARLAPELRDDVCFECHLQPAVAIAGVRRLGRGDWSFRPGTPLPESLLHVDVVDAERPAADRFQINHHAYRLRQSTCFLQSGRKLSCLTCHDPHVEVAPAERAAHFRAACLGCHQGSECGLAHTAPAALPAALRGVDAGDCVTCHMPERRTQDVVHAVMTDHRIRRHPAAPEELLAPLAETDATIADVVAYEPQRFPDGALGEIYRALAVVRLSGTTSPEALDRLTLRLAQLDALDAADRAAPELAEAADPPLADGWIELGTGQLEAHRFAAAAHSFERALAHDPRRSSAVAGLGLARAGQGRPAEALALLRRAAEAPDARPETFFHLGRALADAGEITEAERWLRRATALRPTFGQAWSALAGLALETERPREAARAYRRVLALEPRRTAAYLGLARALLDSGQREEAERFLRHGSTAAAEPAPVAAALERLRAVTSGAAAAGDPGKPR